MAANSCLSGAGTIREFGEDLNLDIRYLLLILSEGDSETFPPHSKVDHLR